MMHERTAHILRAALEEFIETGSPVSSTQLYENYRFGIKPAMIRLELNELTDDGYLEQPHHSAGRVPTNKGYGYFAKYVLDETPRVETDAFANRIEHLFARRSWPDLLDYLSSELGILGVLGEALHGNVYKEGLEHLMERLEWDSRDRFMRVIEDYETLEKSIQGFEKQCADDFLDIFIGKQSPVTQSDELAVIAGDYQIGADRVFLFAIGPKRMDYEKTASLFKGLKQKYKNSHGR